MKRAFYLIFTIVLVSCADQQNESTTNETENISADVDTLSFSGTLDEQYDFRMRLVLPNSENGEVTGAYFYQSQQKEIELNGSKEGAQIELDEYVDGQVTGHFSGVIEIGSLWTIVGDWTNPDKSKSMGFFIIEDVDNLYEDYLTSDDVASSKAMAWEDLLKMFIERNPPFGIDFEKELGEESQIDSSTVLKYLNLNPGESYNEYGFNTHYSRYKYEKDDYLALVVWHEYSPGVGGVYELHIELFTFDKSGKFIDGEQLGCECSDQEPGFNLVYYTNPIFDFREDGTIVVITEHVKSTLFEEELENPDDAVYEVEKTTSIYTVSPKGKITEENPG